MRRMVALVGVVLLLSFGSSPVTAQWHQTGYKERAFFLVSVERAQYGDYLMACTPYGILQTANDGLTWTATGNGLIYPRVQCAAYSYYLYAGTSGGVFRLEWPISSEWVFTSQWLPQDGVLSMLVVDTLLFATTGRSGIYVSADYGLHWLPSSTGLASASPFTYSAHSLTWLDGYLFVASYPGVYRSLDKGQHWSLSSTGITAYQVNCLTAVQNVLYAGTDKGVFRSSDYGVSWSEAVGLSESIESLGTDGTDVFAGLSASPRFFVLKPQAESWIERSENLAFDTRPINSIVVKGNTLFIGTGNGVWARPYPIVTSVPDPAKELPGRFELVQNFPNPFNPSTTIRYALPHRAHVTLTIFNTLGQLVATLVNGEVEMGYHEVQFNGTGLASGLYFYQLVAGEFMQTRQMMVVK